MTDTKKIAFITDRTYDIFKGIVQYVLPGLVTLWLALAAIWNFPHAEAIAGTLTALTAFLGIFVGISKAQYKKLVPDSDGDLLVDITEEGAQALTVALDRPLENVRDRDSVTFNVLTRDDGSTASQ